MKTVPLTPTLKVTFDFILDYIDKHGYPPTISEISEGNGLARTTSAVHINRLISRGYLEKIPYIDRGIIVLERD